MNVTLNFKYLQLEELVAHSFQIQFRNSEFRILSPN